MSPYPPVLFSNDRRSRLAGSLGLAVLTSILACAPPAGRDKPPASDTERDGQPPATTSTSAAAAPEVRAVLTGEQLFAVHCAGCHGVKGDGKGLASAFLFPKPRDFRAGKFRLVSSDNGVPSDADLDSVIRRGMPGSSMPPWPNLTEAKRALLIAELRKLRRDGAQEEFMAQLKEATGEDDPEFDAQELQDFIDSRTKQGELTKVPEIGPSEPASVARGKAVYMQGCSSCHGNEGRGDGQQVMVDIEGLPTRPRDLTRGIYKGEHDPASVYRRIALGMPGTPMPSSPTLTADQIVDLVHFIRSLSEEASRQATVLNRERILAARVRTLPQDDTAWKTIPSQTLRTTPLWWRDGPDPALTAQAAHDGKSIAVRLQWQDDRADERVGQTEGFRDAAAMQLYRGGHEPFLGMGDAKNVVDVWMWDAARRQGLADLADVHPRTVVDLYPFGESLPTDRAAEGSATANRKGDEPNVAFPARAAGNLIATQTTGGSSLAGGGPGSVTFRPPTSQIVEADGHWASGQWTVVMKRPLGVNAPQDGVALAPGDAVAVAFALWDGAARDRNGQKRITIWQDLRLEP